MFFHRKLACSFCGKSAAQVSKLVAGRGAYICDVCTAEAQRIMSDSDGAQSGLAPPPKSRPSADWWRRLVHRSHRDDGESMSIEPA